MKQPKQHGRKPDRQDGPDRRGMLPRDSRPTKPLPGEPAHHAAVPPFSDRVKGEHPPPQTGGRDTRRAKAPFDPASDRPREGSAAGGDQPGEGPVAPRRVGRPGEQYVRLRIRVEGDRLSVVDSHLVDGPLSQTTTFQGTNAYEVTYEDRLLHAGTIPDLGVQRSFPNLAGPPEQRGHFLTSRDVYEFSARVPAQEVTPETINGIRARLHRVEEATSAPRLDAAPLAVQFQGRIVPTAELVGLPESVLPERIAARGGRTATGAADQGGG
jgi:hypothetical protein